MFIREKSFLCIGNNVRDGAKRKKGLMDMDNSVVIAGGRGYKGTKW